MRKYVSTAWMCLREQGHFGIANLLGGYLLRLLSLLALLAIWTSLFRDRAVFDGLTLRDMLSYTVASSVLANLLDVHTPASGWLHDGSLLSLYQRPASVLGQLTAHTVGGWLMPLAMYSLPVAVLATAFGVNLRPASGWFFLSLALAVSEGFAVDFLFACLLIRMRNLEWTVQSIRSALTVLLTGALIPFSALPWGVGTYLQYTPFGTMAGAPLSLFTGLAQPAPMLCAQIFWNAVLWPLAVVWFRRSSERMVSFGG